MTSQSSPQETVMGQALGMDLLLLSHEAGESCANNGGAEAAVVGLQ
jgi:hypothetical protein